MNPNQQFMHRPTSDRVWQRRARLKNGFVAALIFILLFSWPICLSSTATTPDDSTTVSTATREGRLIVFDDVCATIEERYYDPAIRGVDWDALRTEYRPLAAEAKSSREFYALLRRMLARLGDAHTRVFSPEEKFDWWNPRFLSIGIAVREIDGMPVVVKVDKRSAPERAGLRVGDVIESVDGQPALHLIQQRLLEQPTASLHASMRSRAFASVLEGSPETLVTVRWKGRDGTEKNARFERRWQQRELGIRMRIARGKYAVIELDAFTKSIAIEFSRLLKEKLKDVRGIVLDLRGNGGGDTEAMADVASAFLGEQIPLGQFTDRAGLSLKIVTHSRSPIKPNRTLVPLVILTSERTSSASEIFVSAMKAAHRAKIIGTETCGCVLAIRARHALPDGGVLDVSELDFRTSEGNHLEGHPIKSDRLVQLERSDLYAGRDPGLEAALAQLSRTK